jgi:hypothetical protein
VRIAFSAVALSLACAGALLAATAPAARATACTALPTWPGDAAGQPAIAAWMATGATAAGLPGELPVMGALVESGLRNLPLGDGDRAGYFGMRVGIWGASYPDFPNQPVQQLRWFTDQATVVGAQRAADGVNNADPATWGDWVADVERPAEQDRSRYGLQLATATALITAGCPGGAAPSGAPVAVADRAAPILALAGSARTRLTAAGRLRLRVACPAEACRLTVRARLRIDGRRRSLALPVLRARLDADAGRTLSLRLRRDARRAVARALRDGRGVRARLHVTAGDAAGNVTTRTRVVRIL